MRYKPTVDSIVKGKRLDEITDELMVDRKRGPRRESWDTLTVVLKLFNLKIILHS